MLMRRLVPAQAFGQLSQEMNRVFGDALPTLEGTFGRCGRGPALNAWEDGDRLFIEVELPGLAMEDIEVEMLADELTISGRRETKTDDENVTYHRRERGCGGFTRTLRLPDDIDAEKIEAGLKDGVLTITLPKVEAAKPRQIAVKPA